MTQRDKINNCGTSNVVYLITCNACSVSYVGETGNQLRTRLNNHRSDIRHYYDTQVARHFNGAGHSYADLRITILESGPFSDDTSLETIYRRNCESKWITRHKTRQPGGLNIREVSFDIIPIPFVSPTKRRQLLNWLKLPINCFNPLIQTFTRLGL